MGLSLEIGAFTNVSKSILGTTAFLTMFPFTVVLEQHFNKAITTQVNTRHSENEFILLDTIFK